MVRDHASLRAGSDYQGIGGLHQPGVLTSVSEAWAAARAPLPDECVSECSNSTPKELLKKGEDRSLESQGMMPL